MLIVICPYCDLYVQIEQINCGIFRHAVYKTTCEPINPHMSKAEIEKIKDTIDGCGNPFKVVNEVAEKCDYI